MKVQNKSFGLLALCLGLAAAAVPSGAATQTVPGKTWEKITDVSKYGFDRAKLVEAQKFAAENLATAAVMVVVDGKILFEWGAVETKYLLHSGRKSFMSALYGKYVENGAIDLDQTMAELGIDDEPPLTEVEKKATVRHCLMARSGIYHDAEAEAPSMRAVKPPRGSKKPGEFWLYNNWDFNVLLTVFEQKTGKKFFEALGEDILMPIDCENYMPEDGIYQKTGASVHPAYHFVLTARDMARFGLLMLRNGKWNDRQVVSSAWVKESTSYMSDAEIYGGDGYGYMWWVAKKGNKIPHFPAVDLPDGTYSARGAGGHYMIVLPDRDMVIVHRVNTFESNNVGPNGFGLLVRKILDAGDPAARPFPSQTPEEAGKLAGTYEREDGPPLTVTLSGASLVLKTPGQPDNKLIQVEQDVFYPILSNGTYLRFERGENGEPTGLLLRQYRGDSKARKIAEITS
ncbi:MAG: serine hydrolase [Candidatus Aminicenantes bacterium]|nr:serine hydrolase [Candidatus Aminicenantes bacterium]